MNNADFIAVISMLPGLDKVSAELRQRRRLKTDDRILEQVTTIILNSGASDKVLKSIARKIAALDHPLAERLSRVLNNGLFIKKIGSLMLKTSKTAASSDNDVCPIHGTHYINAHVYGPFTLPVGRPGKKHNDGEEQSFSA